MITDITNQPVKIGDFVITATGLLTPTAGWVIHKVIGVTKKNSQLVLKSFQQQTGSVTTSLVDSNQVFRPGGVHQDLMCQQYENTMAIKLEQQVSVSDTVMYSNIIWDGFRWGTSVFVNNDIVLIESKNFVDTRSSSGVIVLNSHQIMGLANKLMNGSLHVS